MRRYDGDVRAEQFQKMSGRRCVVRDTARGQLWIRRRSRLACGTRTDLRGPGWIVPTGCRFAAGQRAVQGAAELRDRAPHIAARRSAPGDARARLCADKSCWAGRVFAATRCELGVNPESGETENRVAADVESS